MIKRWENVLVNVESGGDDGEDDEQEKVTMQLKLRVGTRCGTVP